MQMDDDYPESWNIDDFKNLNTFYERIKYNIYNGSEKIVLVDYGLNDMVWAGYYKR